MSFESDLADLGDPTKRLAATQLVNFSELDAIEVERFEDAWPEIDAGRRVQIVSELTDLAQDSVDLNFDAIYKLALRDEEALVRAAALNGLHEYEGRDLIPVLSDLLRNDADAAVRREAAVALGRYALAAELDQLRAEDAAAVREVLMESAEDLEEDDRVRARSIEALGAISGEETENLIESIYQEDSLWLKVGAVDAMGRSCNENWLPLVIREMENRAPEMRHAAAFAAGEIGDEVAVNQLKRMAVLDPDREVQLAAVHALGEIGGNQAKVALKAILFEGDEALEDAVQEAMSEIEFNEDPMGTL
ncbi:MAG TPA: HEAT repeat domain-containing protein [Dehalococcoidia bacterium]